MKRLLLFVLFALLLAAGPAAAATYHWQGGANDSWTKPANWFPVRQALSVTDTLIFDRGDSMIVNSVPNQQIGGLLVTSGIAVFSDSAAGNTLLFTDGTAGLRVDAGCKMYLSGTNTLNLTLGNTQGTIAGTLVARDTQHRLTAVNTDAINVLAGGRIEARSGFQGNLFGLGVGSSGLNSVRFQSGSLYVQAAGANPFGASQPLSVVRFDHGSRFRLEAGGGTPAAAGRTYADFEHDVASLTPLAGSAGVTMDSLIVKRGQLVIMNASARFNGAIRVAVGSTLNFNPGSAANYTLGGTTPQWIRAPGTRFTVGSNVTLMIDNPAGIYVDSTSAAMSGSIEFIHGRLVLPDVNFPSVLGLLTMNPPGVIKQASAANGWVVGAVNVQVDPVVWQDAIFPVGRERYAPLSLYFWDISSTFRVTGSSLNIDHPGLPFAQLRMDRRVHAHWSFDHTAGADYSSVDVAVSWDLADADPGLDVSKVAVRKLKNQYFLRSPRTGYGAISVATNLPWESGSVHWSFAAGESAFVYVDAGRTLASESSGGMGIPLELSQASIDTVTIHCTTADSTATAGSDYTTTAVTLTILPRDSTFTVSVPIANDAAYEPDESFLLQYTSVTNAIGRDRGEGVILNDDASPIPLVHLDSPNGGEHVVIGTIVPITWTATDDVAVTSVDLLLSRDGGAINETIALALPNTGSYNWTVTGPVTNLARIKAIARDGEGNQKTDASDAVFFIDNVVGVPDAPKITAFALGRVAPNPSFGSARFAIDLPRAARVELSILDVRGRTVATLAHGMLAEGRHPMAWDGRSAAAGIYFVRLTADGFTARERFALLR